MSNWLTAIVAAGLCVVGLSDAHAWAASHHHDVVVYGATAGGIVAAIAASEQKLSVALVDPGTHVGGMVSGGLGKTDHGKKEVVGGMSREFFERVGKHYDEPITWFFEPHVAEKTFKEWLGETKVEYFPNHPISNVEMVRHRVAKITTNTLSTFSASIFIDCSYEGDLMAMAGVTYTWGREGQKRYGESLAGRRERSPFHQFKVPISPFDDNGKLLPFVYGGDSGEVGALDRKVQAYNFRMCLCSDPNNQVPFPKPAGHDPKRYELLRRYLTQTPGLRAKNLMDFSPVHNHKTDSNNNGAFSTDFVGGSWEYPEATPSRRSEIWKEHERYQQGFMYFLANDPGVPKLIHDDINKWGLAKDEFIENNHWPTQLYIREARRMVGSYVMRQQDLQTERTKPDSIGMGSYNSDSHHVQRIPAPDGHVINEGDMQVPVKPYEIAYRCITPRKEQCENLLAPVCFSATHVAYSSIRMEPQYMILGHAAGLAAAHAISQRVPVQAIDVTRLQSELRARRQVLSLKEALPPEPRK